MKNERRNILKINTEVYKLALMDYAFSLHNYIEGGKVSQNVPCVGMSVRMGVFSIINPRRACAARVTVLGLSFCLSVCLSVCPPRYSGSTRN